MENGRIKGMTPQQTIRYNLMAQYIELDETLDDCKDEKEIAEIKNRKKAILRELRLDD